MCSAQDSAALPALGFPIREPAGQRLFSASPRLFAAVHALHRLLVPRHPPCALTILTVIWPVTTLRSLTAGDYPLRPRLSNAVAVATVQFSRVAEGDDVGRSVSDTRPPLLGRPDRDAAYAGLSKLNSMQTWFAARASREPHRRGIATDTSPPARFGRRARPDPTACVISLRRRPRSPMWPGNGGVGRGTLGCSLERR